MPSYLIAIAAGFLKSKRIGPRSKVWSEPEMVEMSADEFAEVCIKHFNLTINCIRTASGLLATACGFYF